MNKSALKITTGAMATAIFGVFLLLNRQTGDLFQEIFLFLYPIPMVAYAAMYGVKSGLPVFAAMSLISIFFGTFTTIFYAVTQALIGLVFGGCLCRRVDMTKTLFVVMVLSAIVNLLNTVVLGFLFGYNLNQEAAELQTMMNTAFQQAGVELTENMLTIPYLKRMFIISMTVFGAIQGFLVYEVSLLILRRLRFPVQKPKSVFLYTPPKWTGVLALAVFFGYYVTMVRPLEDELLQTVVQTAGIFGYLYLVCFGFIALLMVLKVRFPKMKGFSGLICLLCMLLFPMLEMMMGFWYVSGKLHLVLMEQYQGATTMQS